MTFQTGWKYTIGSILKIPHIPYEIAHFMDQDLHQKNKGISTRDDHPTCFKHPGAGFRNHKKKKTFITPPF